MAALGTVKKIAIHISKDTILRRYAADSVRFDDAKPGTLDQIKPGDQLRARGTRNEDGSEFVAEEIVSGSFRNIAGTVSSIEVSQNTISVTDLKTKKPVLVKFTADSQLRKLPPMMAQRIATRLKGGKPADHRTAPAPGVLDPLPHAQQVRLPRAAVQDQEVRDPVERLISKKSSTGCRRRRLPICRRVTL